MAGHSSSRHDGRRFPLTQSASKHLQEESSVTGRLQVLTVKTPLLPRNSGINMESARSYGADMEKHDVPSLTDASQSSTSSRQRRSRLTFNWAAGIALLTLFSIGIYNNVPAYQTAETLVAGMTPSSSGHQRFNPQVGELYNRQSSAAVGDGSNSTRALLPFTYAPIPLGSIQPLGWMKDNMQGMADGLAGHEYDFYPPVQSSPWFGIGTEDYAPLNEGVPYWFNALVPLAYGLGDQRLIGQVQDAFSQIISRQNLTDGWLGPLNPVSHDKTSQDLWARFPVMLAFTQLAEADPSLTPQILNALYRFIPTLYAKLHDGQYPNEVWGRARYADAVITMQWLYENHPQFNGTDYRPLLSNTMYRLKDHGIDWVGYFQPQSFFFQDIDYVEPAVQDDTEYFPFLHGVNAGQGLKTPAVDYRFTHNDSLLDVQRNAIDWSLQYHGNAMGSLVGDERENGVNPNRGSELCTAVETMFSMTYAYAVSGVNAFADNAERIAFNALPGMMTADNWAHQYIALSNQPWASPLDGGAIFWNVGDYGATFGTAPNYPCCTVNHPQGYSKFLSHSYMTVGDDGLAHVLLSPSNATTKLTNGANVNVAAITDYPFSDILTYKITSDAPFTFYIRVPNWAGSAMFEVNGEQVPDARASSDSGLATIAVPAGQTTIQYILTSSLQTVNRANDTVAVYNGALLYALDVGYAATTSNANADITRNNPPTNNSAVQVALAYNSNQQGLNAATTPPQARDYNISNTMAWNYALDPASLKFFTSNSSSDPGAAVNQTRVNAYAGESADSSSDPPALPNPIWSYQAPAQYVKGIACLINWPLKGNAPYIPPLTNERDCQGNSVEVVLRPYGSLKVHMAELPTKSLGGPSLNATR